MSRNIIVGSSLAWMLLLGSAWCAEPARKTGIRWQTDYRQAQRIRAEQQRPMLIFVTMDSCHHCHKMLATTYKDPIVANSVSRAFVATVVNSADQPELARALGVRIYPTTFLVGPDNRVVDRMEGYQAAGQFRKRLDLATRRYTGLARVRTNTNR